MRRDLLAVAAFQAVLSLLVVGKAVHVDEAVYVSMSRHALADPKHPGDYTAFWSGQRRVASAGVPNPWLPAYLLAPAAAPANLRLGRLSMIPVDAAAAVFLYLLASQFLAKPLIWVLAILAGPGWWLTIPSILAEKSMAAFGLAALWCAGKVDPKKPDRWFWASAALSSLAVLSKYTGAVFPVTAAAFFLARGASPALLASWLALALGPSALHLASGLLEPDRLRALASRSTPGAGTGSAHHARALLAFLPGSVPALAVWAWPAARKRRVVWLCAAAGAALLCPAFDLAPTTGADRALGILLCAAGSAALAAAFEKDADRRRWLWLGLAASTLLLQGLVYWSVTARYSIFAAAALAIGLAAALERRLGPAKARVYALAGLLASAALGAAAAATDFAHAEAQRRAANELAAPAKAAGRRVWFTGHWSFQHYMQEAGAEPIVPQDGGWDNVRLGDLAIVPGINTNIIRPTKPVRASVSIIDVPAPLPFLLMCGAGWRCQAGFHSSAYGFLPFSLSREPIERFEIVEVK